MDDKSRLKIPSAFRRVIDEKYEGGQFFVTSITGRFAHIYPLKVWEEIELKLAGVSKFSNEKEKFLDFTSYYGLDQQMDAQGRIVIHSPLRNEAALNGEVIVIGKGDYLTVWNLERFRSERLEKNSFTEQDARVLESHGI